MNIKLFRILTGLIFLMVFVSIAKAQKRDLFEIKIYHIERPEQETVLDQYLEKAFIPAMHRAGVDHIGVFKPVPSDPTFGKVIYVFSPYKSLSHKMKVDQKVKNDKEYLSEGESYITASPERAPYQRIETILLQAFEGMRGYKLPDLNNPKSKRVYELRSYESATEERFANKVHMFNNGEIDIFERLGFNAVFYGEVIAGSKMPNLMYMTTFEDLDSEKMHWDAFRADDQWNKMKVMEQYQNNVSGSDIMLLTPADYSDI
ncbi:NIPSNAP family protein [Membranihabitans maritimus]|uniref:NIPSNAP family protein n=1 Tax=Membranihabitans maritimus TaxID=2904244 RepID=UPI001F2F7F95|nr:NIPSNAP family protein [Membranihabitans maritimus]